MGLNVIVINCSRNTTGENSIVDSSAFCDPQNKSQFSKLEINLRLCMFHLGDESHYFPLICIWAWGSVLKVLLDVESWSTTWQVWVQTGWQNHTTLSLWQMDALQPDTYICFIMYSCPLSILSLLKGSIGIIIRF